jgi:hypothetical protein
LQKEGIYLVGEASVPDDVIKDAEYYFKQIGPDFHIEIIPERGPQAGVEWFLTTLLVIFFTKPFLENLAKKISSDFYKLVKLGISSIWDKFFSQNPKYKYKIIVTGKKLQDDFEFSPVFSIYIELSDSIKLKFLYKQNWTHEEFDEATDKFLYNVDLLYSGQNGELIKIIENSGTKRGIILITFDEREKKLEIVNANPQKNKP